MNITDHRLVAKKEYQSKLKLKQKIERYYKNQAVKNGLKSLDKIQAYLPSEYKLQQMRRGIAFAHLDLEIILELMASKKEFTVISGLNPSSSLHLGHKSLFDLLVGLQQLGGRVFIPVTNDESYVERKAVSLAESRKQSYESVIPDIIALGLKPSKTHIFVDSDYPDLYNFAMHLSKYITIKEVEAAFGEKSLQNPGQVFYRSVVQMAQILLPQLPEFGGPKPTLIPVGIDQHPYVLLARDVAKKLKLVPPSELVIKLQQSLQDPQQKMSGSKPKTALYLTDNRRQIKEKIKKAYTGSVSSLDIHQQMGGLPEICSVFSLLNTYSPTDGLVKEVYDNYKNGSLRTDKLKNIVYNQVLKEITNHQRKRSQVTKNKIKRFLLKKPLRSFLNY